MILWTDRDLEIVQALTQRVTVLTLRQITAVWWCGVSDRAARRRLGRLIGGGLISRHLVNAVPSLTANEPVVTWNPGDDVPTFLSRTSQTAQRFPAAVPTETYVATRFAANVWGSGSFGLPGIDRINHELKLAEVFTVWSRQTTAQEDWSRFHPPYRRTALHNCAVILNPDGQVARVVRTTSGSSKLNTSKFHLACAERSLSYELW